MRRGGGGGSVVNIITMASHGGEPVLTAYSSSKGALATLTRNAGYQLQPDRIRVNGLNIGWTATEGEHACSAATGQPADWLAAADAAARSAACCVPDDIAPMVTYLLSDARADGHRLGHRLRPDRARPLRRHMTPSTEESNDPVHRPRRHVPATAPHDPAHHRAGDRALPGGAAQRARRPPPAPDPGHARHLRPRQRGRPRAGARRVPGRAAVLPGPQRAVDGAHRRRLRQGQPPHGRRSPSPRRSARAPRTWSPAPRWPRSTASRCCCSPATPTPRAGRARCSSSSSTPPRAT